MPRTLVQIVPPGEGGVLDYAECLKAQWMRSGKPSQLLALSQPLAKQASLAQRVGNPATALSVVLHFSGYGYARRGLCGWLLEELNALRAQRQAALHLVVVFHELFASGPPWPLTRPVLPRTSSATSGFFFCGMIDEPVQ